MSVEFHFEIDSAELTARLSGLVREIQGSVLEVAGRTMLNYFKDYHTAFAGKWKGSKYMAGSTSGRFATDVITGWQNPVRTGENEVKISNIQPYLAHKVTGGPITPKRGKFLTIPLIPEAKGRLAKEFETSLGVKLFRIGQTLAYKGPGGKPIATYALSRGVNQAPWPGAMPSNDTIQQQFAEALSQAIEDVTQ